MSSQTLFTDVFGITVDDLLVMPEIQELLTTAVSDLETASPAPTTTSHSTPPDLKKGAASSNSHDEDSRDEMHGKVGDWKIAGVQAPDRTPRTKSAASGTSQEIHPTGQRVHVMNEDELNGLCWRLGAQTAALRQAKLQKNEVRGHKLLIQQLRVELSRLQQTEAQLKQYEQRSVQSLEEELALHQREVADLSRKLQHAAVEETDWVWMSWQHLFGPEMSDLPMMREILELLAMDGSSQEDAASTTADGITDSSNHSSVVTEFNHSSTHGSNHNGGSLIQEIVDASCADDVAELAWQRQSAEETSSAGNHSSEEQKRPAELGPEQMQDQGAEFTLGSTQQQMQKSMYAAPFPPKLLLVGVV
ncbi:hypothetical protein PHYPSEUDO_003598 [Phytophthora pseudosyringae]|uniref:Uncharacterized protein n=1 Tax=Phytophthora pseudosyringae TaxID=221518 RepID=A0A8T1VQ76_9STRA|nr:hypothetical protein PHYPSEUDO_003598 [Phytophthora pseudosyringae]